MYCSHLTNKQFEILSHQAKVIVIHWNLDLR